MEVHDAHCHYQFAEVPYAAVELARSEGVGYAVINGSSPADWADVAALAASGFRSIICNRPDGEEAGQPPAATLAEAAAAHGLDNLTRSGRQIPHVTP